MQNRHTILAITVLISLSIFGCTNCAKPNEEAQIGIITDAPTQSYASLYAKKLEEQSNNNGMTLVVNACWPENCQNEQEQVQQIIFGMLTNPMIGALIMSTVNPAAGTVMEEAANLREDFFNVGCISGDDASIIASQVDLVLSLDRASMVLTSVEQAGRMGAKTFVYYYFPIARYVSAGIYKPVDIQLFETAQKTCADFGVDFVPIALPQGIGLEPGLDDFITRDVPDKVALYGSDTAFYSYSCALQSSLLAQIIEQGAIYPLPCCPSPYHGLTQALDIEIEEEGYGNYEDAHLKTSKLLSEKGVSGRLASFMVDYVDLELKASYEYAEKWLHEEVSKKGVDLQVLQEIMEDIAGTSCHIRYYEEDGVTYDNYILYCLEPYIIY